MATPQTEKLHLQAEGMDTLSGTEILSILHQGHVAAAEAVGSAIEALDKGAEAMARTVRDGGNLVYAAAGSSGLMGLADGLELTPTFGIPNARIRILRAGGLEDIARPKGNVEDDIDAARADAEVIGPRDCVICVAASGNTTYPVTIMHVARQLGVTTIGIANNAGTALLTDSDIPVFLPTPPEAIAGSTRLGAGTAQKIALNMMSSLMGVRLGHVMDGMMVNVIANNAKLFRRAENIVMEIANCDRETAAGNLRKAGGGVKEAILLAEGATGLNEAKALLEKAEQNLRTALSMASAERSSG